MPRYHLHLYDRVGVSLDEEGLDLPDLDAARASAIDGIRSVASQDVLGGSLDLEGRIEIADAAGAILGIVPFSEAVEVHPPEEER